MIKIRKYKKYLSTALALSLLAVLISSCGGKNDKNDGNTDVGGKNKYTLTVWGAERDMDMLKSMCSAYAEANKQNEYKFLFGVQGESDSPDKVLGDVESGPDVYSFASDALGKLIAGGALARVGGDIEKSVRETNSAESVGAASMNISGEDRLWAYPCTADNCAFLYYDKRVINEDDTKTLDGLLSAAGAVCKSVHFKLNDDGWYLSSFFFADPDLYYEVELDDAMVERSVKINFDSEAGLDVMKALRKYISNDALVVQTDDSKMLSALRSGQAAAVVSGTWNADAFSEAIGKENLGVCALPSAKIGGREMQLSGYMGYKLIGVNGFSKNKGEAHKLAAWLTNEENQLIRFRERGFAPTNKSAAASDEVTGDMIITAVYEQAKHNRTQKSVPSNYWTPMGTLVTPIVKARSSGDKITDEMLQNYLDALCAQIRK